jgi:hypothetical protein
MRALNVKLIRFLEMFYATILRTCVWGLLLQVCFHTFENDCGYILNLP